MKKHLFLLASLCVVLASCEQTHRGSGSSTTTSTTTTTDPRNGEPVNRGARDPRSAPDARDPRVDSTNR